MKTIGTYLSAICFVFLLVNPAVSAQEQVKPDVFGYFFIAGKVPVAFRNIAHLSLDGDYGRSQNPPTYGRIRLKSKRVTDYILLGLTINGTDLSFKTAAVRGISYELAGALSRADFNKEPRPRSDEIVLTGIFKKLQNGKVIAESPVKFTWELGD